MILKRTQSAVFAHSVQQISPARCLFCLASSRGLHHRIARRLLSDCAPEKGLRRCLQATTESEAETFQTVAPLARGSLQEAVRAFWGASNSRESLRSPCGPHRKRKAGGRRSVSSLQQLSTQLGNRKSGRASQDLRHSYKSKFSFPHISGRQTG